MVVISGGKHPHAETTLIFREDNLSVGVSLKNFHIIGFVLIV